AVTVHAVLGELGVIACWMFVDRHPSLSSRLEPRRFIRQAVHLAARPCKCPRRRSREVPIFARLCKVGGVRNFWILNAVYVDFAAFFRLGWPIPTFEATP